MPIIVRKCQHCDNETENIESRSEADKEYTTCPKCGKELLTRKISSSSFALKGSWYKQGY